MELSDNIARAPVQDEIRWLFMKQSKAQSALFTQLRASLQQTKLVDELHDQLMQRKRAGWPHFQSEFDGWQKTEFDALWGKFAEEWHVNFTEIWEDYYKSNKGIKKFSLPIHAMIFHLGSDCIDYVVRTLKSDLWSDDGFKEEDGQLVETPRGFLKASNNEIMSDFLSAHNRAASQGLLYAVMCNAGAIERGQFNSVVPGVEVRFLSSYLQKLRDIVRSLAYTDEWYEKSLDTPRGMAREIAKRHKKSTAEKVEAALSLYFACADIGSSWPSVFAPNGKRTIMPDDKIPRAEQANTPDGHWLEQIVGMLSQNLPTTVHVDCDEDQILVLLDTCLEALLGKCLPALSKQLPIAGDVFLMETGTDLRVLLDEMRGRGKGGDLRVPNVRRRDVKALAENRKDCIAYLGQSTLMKCVSNELKRIATGPVGANK